MSFRKHSSPRLKPRIINLSGLVYTYSHLIKLRVGLQLQKGFQEAGISKETTRWSAVDKLGYRLHQDGIPCIQETRSTATFLQAPIRLYTCRDELRALWERKIERSMLWHKLVNEILGAPISWAALLLAKCTTQAKCMNSTKSISRRQASQIRWSLWSLIMTDQTRSESKVTTTWMDPQSSPHQRPSLRLVLLPYHNLRRARTGVVEEVRWPESAWSGPPQMRRWALSSKIRDSNHKLQIHADNPRRDLDQLHHENIAESAFIIPFSFYLVSSDAFSA
jgi:hypothetical protein